MTALSQSWLDVDLTNPQEVLTHALELYHPRVAMASSFGLEDVVTIDMLMSIQQDARVFALDTGRLNPETYECADAVQKRYGIQIIWFFPKHQDVETLERGKGVFSFRENVENRQECCHIRKVEPLNRALTGLDAWITGMRREQSITRSGLETVEVDTAHGNIVKINPLATWTLEDIWAYVRRRRVPYNRLHDMAYPSIGCAPCTRAIRPGEDAQAAGGGNSPNTRNAACT